MKGAERRAIKAQKLLEHDEAEAPWRVKVFERAAEINGEAVNKDHRGLGKFKRIIERNRAFAAALLVIAQSGGADHQYADGTARIGQYIVGEDGNGFVWYGTENAEEAAKHEAREKNS
jgi:hypothetical protein